jgi:hypothetical protein
MIRNLLSTLRSAMSRRLHQELGRASVLCACEGTYRFSGHKSVMQTSQGIDQQREVQVYPDTNIGKRISTLTPAPGYQKRGLFFEA